MRETGYYWCLLEDCWDIYYYNSNRKLFYIMDVDFKENEFKEIDEKQIKKE